MAPTTSGGGSLEGSRYWLGYLRWRNGIVFAASPSVALMSIANWLSQIPPLAFIWEYFPITQIWVGNGRKDDEYIRVEGYVA